MKRRSVVYTATAGAAAGVLGLTGLALPAGAADPQLPPIQPKKLVASVMTSKQPAMSGTVKVTNNLGLPAIPGMEGTSQLLSGGTSTFRVWSDGQGRHRVSLPSQGGGTTIVDDGNTVWKWSSDERAVTKYQADGAHEKPERRAPADPAAAARRAVDKLRESSKVAVDGTASVAGRDAYELVLTPKPTERTVLREVRIAVGAENRVPLRVVVNTNGSDDPALKVGFSRVEFGPQDPGLFQFTPPEGAKVKKPEPHEGPEAQRSTHQRPRVIGEGWDTVVMARLPEEAVQARDPRQNPEGSEGAAEGPSNLRGFAERIGEPVSGPWGHGWIVTTRAGSALLTADGRVAAGAVPAQVLTEAMGTR